MIYILIIISLLVNYTMLYYELGLGLFIAVLLQLCVITYSLYIKQAINKSYFIKLGLTLMLIAPFILRDMLVFKVLTLLALPLIYSLFYIDFKSIILLDYIGLILDVCFRPLARFHLFFKTFTDKIFKGREEVKYIVTGIAITIPFLLIILPLLISSDLILESMTLDFFDSLEFSSSILFRIVFIVLFCSYWFGQFSYDLKTLITKEKLPRLRGKQSVFITYTFLTIINLIYGLYVFIQVKYLFLNVGVLPEGITYADYAREGFFQLVLVTIINITLIILLELLNHTNLFKQRLLETFTLITTSVMAVSAFYRMSLYEESYGYTTLRLLVFLFLVFLIVIMVLLMTYLISNKIIILNVISIFVIITYIIVSWANLDSYVAKENIKRYELTDEIDIVYLTSLSLDARKEILYIEENYPDLLIISNINEENQRISYNGELILPYIHYVSDEEIKWQEWNIYK